MQHPITLAEIEISLCVHTFLTLKCAKVFYTNISKAVSLHIFYHQPQRADKTIRVIFKALVCSVIKFFMLLTHSYLSCNSLYYYSD